MPVHDWGLVDAGIFHAFHTAWVTAFQNTLNDGRLPEGFYALAEQHAGQSIADVLTLQTDLEPGSGPGPSRGLGTTVLDRPPRMRHKETVETTVSRQRSLAIRHVSGHRLVALLEIVSPANKDRPRHVDVFAEKVAAALEYGVHVLVLDLINPGPHDPRGLHEIIRAKLANIDHPYDLPADEPLTLVSYAAGPKVEVYLEHLAVGASLPEMPLFLQSDRYIDVPLESYQDAYRGMPAYWRNVLQGGNA